MLKEASPPRLVDVNVHLSRWPFRRLPGDDTEDLVRRLKSQGVAKALVSSFDGLLHRDIRGVNLRLVDECRRYGDGMLVPIGAINPTLTAWESDLRYCAQTPAVRGVRLYPGYHDYALDDPRVVQLCELCAEAGLLVQIAVRMEDPRTQHPRFIAEPVDVGPMADIVRENPELRVILLNAGRDVTAASAGDLSAAGPIYFEISHIEGTGGVAAYLKQLPSDRLLFGSHFPFFYADAAVLKMQESALGQQITEMIAAGNAARLLKSVGALRDSHIDGN